MKQLVIISGKGGTGKTSIAAAFAALAERPVMADCDVDAADLHLILKPEPGSETRKEFTSGYEAVLDESLCTGCGMCVEACRFNALEMVESDDGRQVAGIIPYACEGCGACEEVCPAGAFVLRDLVAGDLLSGRTRFGPLVHARLAIGQGASGKLVSLVRARAREVAQEEGGDLIIIDGSPGIGCPVIASLTGADAALIITEPSVSGLHDLRRIAELCAHFKMPSAAVVNKFDIHEGMTLEIEDACREGGIAIMGRVPFDRIFIDAMLAGQTVVEYGDGPATDAVKDIWHELSSFASFQ